MGKYIKQFNAHSNYTLYKNGDIVLPNVSRCDSEDHIHYNPVGLLNTPLTFEITGDGDIVWRKNKATAIGKSIEYSKNGGEWIKITASTISGVSFSVVSGDTVQFRGNNSTYGSEDEKWVSFSGTTAQFNIKGNIMSLINSTNFFNLNVLSSVDTFIGMFKDCTNLINACDLILPATTLIDYCYGYMFQGCTSLTQAPKLPATTLTFMCYTNMFNGCTNLNYIKCLATDISATNCTLNWVSGVASSGTFIGDPNSSWSLGNNGIPTNWNTNVKNIISI